jgi:hypothetical protein
MPNPIKYTTGTETLALKKGNFYIGTGDVGKGPTSSTGYYNGISPPTGGYTIYLNKETGGPSIYTVSNDAQLISLTNSIAGQSYTTVNECLVYFAGQTDKVVLNRDYEGIVTNGLVLNLDAGFTPSYPTSGTTWYDLSSQNNNGTLLNGPTFSSLSGGSIVFDGTDDYTTLGNPTNLRFIDTNESFSIDTWFKITSDLTPILSNLRNSITTTIIGKGGYDGAIGIAVRQDSDISTTKYIVSGARPVGTSANIMSSSGLLEIEKNQPYYVTLTVTPTLSQLYINGIFITGSTDAIIPGTYDNSDWKLFPISNLDVAPGGNPARASGNVYSVKIYNRALSDSEVLQNFNAQKGRFGL